LPEEPAGAITLSTALVAALLRSPELSAFSWRARASEAEIIQAGLLPNPEVRAEVEDVGASGEFAGIDQAQATLRLSQLIELGGKRMARVRDASLTSALAGWDYEARRLDVFTATAQSFTEVLAQQQRLELAEEVVRLAEEVVGTARQRVDAGSSPRTELTKAEIALAGARIEREQAARALNAARQRLAATWGAREPRFTRAEGNLENVRAVPPLVELRTRLEQNPDLARWATEIAQRDAAVALEKSRAIPDVIVTAGYRRLFGPDENTFVADVLVPLPVFNRNQGAILAAQRRLSEAQDQQLAAGARLSADLTDAYEALAAAYGQISALRNAVLPSAKEAFDTVREGYREGRFSYLDVLDAQRTLVASRGQYVRALADYHQSTVAVERLIGEPITGTSVGNLQTEGNAK
jgi:cobalt-zinc-cadmium efflux system outer membrane protein